jgi:PIN domain nuclease of toxin-antitoxin system
LRALLDTHALIWWVTDDPQLSRRAYEFISDRENIFVVSAASAWEIATKFRLGRLPDAARLAEDVPTALAREGFAGLPVTVAHGQRAGLLPEPVRDPFDRMLIAQAQAEDLVLVSNERAFDNYGINRIW